MVIHLTDSAIEAFHKNLEERDTPKARIRLGVKGAGCSGFQYIIQYEDDPPREKDVEYFFNGIRVVVDKKSLIYLNDCIVDWENTLIAQDFKFINPKEKSRCGCGSSFTV